MASRIISLTVGLMLMLGLAAEPIAAAAPARSVDLSFVSADFGAAIVFNVPRLLESEIIRAIPSEAMFESFERECGYQLGDVAQVMILVGSQVMERDFKADRKKVRVEEQEDQAGGRRVPKDKAKDRTRVEGFAAVVFRFKRPVDKEMVLAKRLEPERAKMRLHPDGRWEPVEPKPEVVKHAGRSYYKQASGYPEGLVYFPDDRTVVALTDADWEPVMRRMVAARGQDSPLRAVLEKAGADHDVLFVGVVEPLREAIEHDMPGASQPRLLVSAMQALVKDVESWTVAVNLHRETLVRAEVVGRDAESARRLEALAQLIFKMAKTSYADIRSEIPDEFPFGFGDIIVDVFDGVIQSTTIAREATTVTIEVKRPEVMEGLPARLAVAIGKAQRQQRLEERRWEIGEVARALRNYADEREGRFPPAAIRGGDGRPLLSWRVAILPQLGEQELYEQFHLDEPWDSPHNKKLIVKMPGEYDLQDRGEDGRTTLVVVVGEGTPFGGAKGVRREDITDGLGNTVLLMEVPPEKSVIWTKPDDLRFDPDKPLAPLGKIPEDGLWAEMFDDEFEGTVLVTPDTAPAIFKAALTHQGGER